MRILYENFSTKKINKISKWELFVKMCPKNQKLQNEAKKKLKMSKIEAIKSC